MENDKIVKMITERCDIFYDDALISKEKIIGKYLMFFAKQFDPEERSVNFAFHTGSLCFDAASIAAIAIGCLAYEFSSNDEILSGLEIGDLVLYKKERYHWMGVERRKMSPDWPENDYIVLTQDANGKSGESKLWIIYDKNKHLIKPYNGASNRTDGRGIRKDQTNRTDFISAVLGIPLSEVPTALDISVVIVADKNDFVEICQHLRIRYADGKYVSVSDVLPISYYTASGEQFQIGKNQAKSEAVIKVTSKLSMARELVLDKHGNKVIGILVTNHESLASNSSELNDLLRRKSLKFACVTAPFSGESCEMAMEQHENAKMFACTKELLSSSGCWMQSSSLPLFACTKELLSSSGQELQSANKLTLELNRQIKNILSKEIITEKVDGPCNWERFKKLKDDLYAIKQSNWTGEDRDNFVLSAIALINLFSTAFFGMKTLESAIIEGIINAAVVSPEVRLTELQNIAVKDAAMKDKCAAIVSELMDLYARLYETSPKGASLRKLLAQKHGKTVLIVPKAYYCDLFSMCFPEFTDVICITANRFDKQGLYDSIVVIGDIIGKRFDALQCFSSAEITLILYDFEAKTFSYRKHQSAKAERKLNARIKGLTGEEYIQATKDEDNENTDIQEETVKEFSDLDDFIDSLGLFDIRKITAVGNGGTYNTTSEVKFVGTFTTGEQILFSKYYSAVVYDQEKNEIVETSPEKLVPGDVLVFTKRNDYTKNIVDQIFDQLMGEKKLSSDIQDAAEKAYYWKEILREYKDKNNLSFRAITKALKGLGSSLQEVTIRQWLIDESHIIGPRNAETMRQIAELTQDPYMLADPDGYFEGCRTVRHYRREILNLIAQAINDKLSNKEPAKGSAFEVVYENIENLSETMELEKVFELDEVAEINNSMVNRPITESEVLM